MLPHAMFRAVALSTVICLAVTLAAPSPVEAAYTSSCSAGTQEVEYAIVIRTHRAPYDAALGDATARLLLPCQNASASRYSYPLVMPANIDSNSVNGRIIQAGYMQCSTGSRCGDIPVDGQIHFVYTPSDDAGGALARADGWAGGPPMGRSRAAGIARSTTRPTRTVMDRLMTMMGSGATHMLHVDRLHRFVLGLAVGLSAAACVTSPADRPSAPPSNPPGSHMVVESRAPSIDMTGPSIETPDRAAPGGIPGPWSEPPGYGNQDHPCPGNVECSPLSSTPAPETPENWPEPEPTAASPVPTLRAGD